MKLRIFTEPQEGATYDDLARGRAGGRAAGVRRVLPIRPLSVHQWGRPRAGFHRRLAHPRRAGPRDRDDPAGHPRAPPPPSASRAAGHQRRAGRPDERRPGRAGPGRRGGTTPNTAPTASPLPLGEGALRPAGGAARDHHRAVGGRGSRSPTPATTTKLVDSPALPKPVQDPPPIIIGGLRRPPHAQARRPPTPPSTTSPSARSKRSPRGSPGSGQPAS